MLHVAIAGFVICCWALLSVLGGERQRRLQEREAASAEPHAPLSDSREK
jgi:hypothetical protein